MKRFVMFQRWLDRWVQQPPKPFNGAKYVLPMMAAGGVLGLLALTASMVPVITIATAVAALGLYVGGVVIIYKCLPVSED